MQLLIDKCSQCDCGGKRPIVNKKHHLCDIKNRERIHGKENLNKKLQDNIKKQQTKKKESIERSIQKARNKAQVKRKLPKLYSHQDELSNKVKDSFFGKKRKSVRRVSDKQKDINEKYAATCEEMDSTSQLICSGCSLNQGGEIRLSHSHIISRADCKSIGRIDLIADKRNIKYHCLDFGHHKGCHAKWESKNVELMRTLNDFDENMEFVKSISEPLYNQIINR